VCRSFLFALGGGGGIFVTKKRRKCIGCHQDSNQPPEFTSQAFYQLSYLVITGLRPILTTFIIFMLPTSCNMSESPTSFLTSDGCMGKLFLDCKHVPSNKGSGYYAVGFAVNLITQYQFLPKWTNGHLIEGV
jgi:hypothetical protein